MLDINEIITLFDINFEIIKDMIMQLAVFSLEPKKEDCKTIESGLRKLAECRNKNASALYAIIAAYDNCCKCFSTSFAIEMIFKTNSTENYHKILNDEFLDIVDEELYYLLYSMPAIWLLEQTAQKIK